MAQKKYLDYPGLSDYDELIKEYIDSHADTNTHRPIQVNGTQILGDNTTPLNLNAGNNVSISNSGGTVTVSATNTWDKVSTTKDGYITKLPGDTSKYLRGDGNWATLTALMEVVSSTEPTGQSVNSYWMQPY